MYVVPEGKRYLPFPSILPFTMSPSYWLPV
jgi:hypothetical protein